MSMNKELIEHYYFNVKKYGTLDELLLLDKLIESGINFKYKYAIPNDTTYYMANFYIPDKHIIINLSTSTKIKSKDIIKDEFCKNKGFKVIRILKSNVSSFNISSVL